MYSIEILVAEHDNVLRLCAIMRKACLLALENKEVNTQHFKGFLHIIREYADKHHHGKEEVLLFKEMEERLGTAAQRLVRNGMLVEHDLGRLYAQQMENAIIQYEKAESRDSLLDIITNAMAYADLLKRHIERENSVVYPFAENNLSAQIFDELNEKTRAFEARQASFLSGALTQLNELEKAY